MYALVYYLAGEIEQINQLRRKYDPQVDLIAPHITLVFPLPESIGETYLISHIENILCQQKPFPLHLHGLQKSWDDYLFLLLQEGKEEVIHLHHQLYTGVLAKYHKQEIEYLPHVTLGVFTENKNKYAQAYQEAEDLKLDLRCLLDRLHLVKLNDEWSKIVWSKEFLLPKEQYD